MIHRKRDGERILCCVFCVKNPRRRCVGLGEDESFVFLAQLFLFQLVDDISVFGKFERIR